jgi:hypothetical protein
MRDEDAETLKEGFQTGHWSLVTGHLSLAGAAKMAQRGWNEKFANLRGFGGFPGKWGHASSFSTGRCAGTHPIRGGT